MTPSPHFPHQTLVRSFFLISEGMACHSFADGLVKLGVDSMDIIVCVGYPDILRLTS